MEPGATSARIASAVSVSSHSESISRVPTATGPVKESEITPEEADARQFEERLQRAAQGGLVPDTAGQPEVLRARRDELCRRFPVQLVDFEGLFLDCLKQIADKAGVKWDLVLKTDATTA